MIIIVLMIILQLITAHHQHNDFNNEYKHRTEGLLKTKYHHMRNLRHAPENYRRLKLIPKVYSHPFKIKHSYQDLPSSEKVRVNRQDQQRIEKWNFNPLNPRQSSNGRNYHLIGKNTVKNVKSHPVEKNEFRRLPGVRSKTLFLKKNYNSPIASGKITGAAFNKNSKPFHSLRNSLIANPQTKEHPYTKMKRYNGAFFPKKRKNIISKNLPRKKKSLFENFYVGDTLLMIELFFIFIPLASFAGVVLTVAHYCWKRRYRRTPDPPHSLEQSSESTIGSALLQEHILNDIHPPNLSKSESEIWRGFISNEIDADGDKVGKRMKLERWMYQKCKCCPEDRAKIKNKLKLLRQGNSQNVQSRNNKGTASESNMPLVPNPRLSPTIGPPVETPFPSTSKQDESTNDSRYPVTVNPSDQYNSLRTFDSHIKVTQQAKDKKYRKESKSRKRRDKGLKDSTNKYPSEPFGVYDKAHKTRKH
ncbi:hypothetical protein HNY73_008286 [Argiope bruennichi]|uniref:Uncharacterized protein n=1 Tax=Argiope bruennichi TaxID=94029 RepID=A0A8T0F6W0_ARGBR|nr:hypothetical protein HNY73_008286 [Argiope bruennichi]